MNRILPLEKAFEETVKSALFGVGNVGIDRV